MTTELTARDVLVTLACTPHALHYSLPDLARLLDEPPPEWCDYCTRWVFPWEEHKREMP